MFERYSDRARRLIFIALWSARERGGSYIEPDDLLHALILEDRGDFASISAEMFPEAPGPIEFPTDNHRRFFEDEIARDLLRELEREPQSGAREPAPQGDMPVSESLKRVFATVAKAHWNDKKIIEPLDLLAGIVEERESRLARLLRDHGITRQKVAEALDSGADHS